VTTLFISDLHLEDSKPALTDFFLGFIDCIAVQATRLFILGDFFEVWVGDDEQSELHIRVAEKLAKLAKSGVEILIMQGNRDFLLGQRYALQCGASLIEDPSTLTIGGKKTLLMHGDTLCTDDTQYMKFRQLARSPEWQQQVLARPLADRKIMARQMRQMSEAKSLGKTQAIMDVAQQTVRSVINQHNADILLHGHTHRPAEHTIELKGGSARRLVLGDWHESTWYAKADNGKLQLIHLKASEL
jgi:UDP-2,3-diacylglucosamine hydrolase